jgi:hypothetical protein
MGCVAVFRAATIIKAEVAKDTRLIGTFYALALLRAPAAEVKRVFLRLLARLGVDRNLAYR